MITYYVSAEAIALGLSESEKCAPAALVKKCLLEHGLGPWDKIESELFQSAGESLLIARPLAPRRERLTRPGPRLERC